MMLSLNKYIHAVFDKSFFLHIFELIQGIAGAQLIHFCSLLILARLYDFHAFGLLSICLVVSSLLATLFSGCLNHAVITAEDDQKVVLLVYTSLGLAMMLLMAIIVIVLGISEKFYIQFSISQPVLLLAALHGFLNAIYSVQYAVNVRAKNFRSLSLNRIVATLGGHGLSISLALASSSVYGLIFGAVAEQLLYVLGLVWKNRKFYSSIKIRSDQLWSCLALHQRFTLYLIPATFLDRLASQVHQIVLARLLGPATLGPLEMHRRGVAMPMSLFASTIGDVFKQRAGRELSQNRECRQILNRTLVLLTIIAVVPFLLLAIWGPSLFALVFGEQWRIAGEYAQVLSPVFLLGMVISPVTSLFFISSKQHYAFWSNLCTLLLVVVGTLVAYYFEKTAKSILLGYSLAYVTKYCLQLYLCYKIAR